MWYAAIVLVVAICIGLYILDATERPALYGAHHNNGLSRRIGDIVPILNVADRFSGRCRVISGSSQEGFVGVMVINHQPALALLSDVKVFDATMHDWKYTCTCVILSEQDVYETIRDYFNIAAHRILEYVEGLTSVAYTPKPRVANANYCFSNVG